MDISTIQEFIDPLVLILIPAMWLLGYFLKQIPKIPNWAVVWAILFVSILAALFIVGFDVNGVIQGVLVAGVSTLGYDLAKQTKKGVTE